MNAQSSSEVCAVESNTTSTVDLLEQRRAHRADLIAALARSVGDDGSGNLGVHVDAGLAQDPDVTAEDLIASWREAEAEWAAEVVRGEA